jgi:hypothetical protein
LPRRYFTKLIPAIPAPLLIAAVTFFMSSSTINVDFLGIKDDSDIRTVYAQFDPSSSSPEQLREQAEDFLSTLTELRNQSGDDALSTIDEDLDNSTGASSETGLSEEQFATDVSGHYNNSAYGILDFVLPSGWYGSEKQWSGDKSISLDMHSGTEAQYMDRLMTPPSSNPNNEDDIITTMTLESNDKAQLQYTQSLLNEMSQVSDTGECETLNGTTRLLEPNSTATIGGKLFNITTTECSYSSDESRSRTIEVLKTYRHESPERVYSLQLKAFKDSFNVSQDSPPSTLDIKKYAPIIDTAVRTLKIK